MATAIFLGAGAAAAEGGPVQAVLFRDYFISRRRRDFGREMWGELATFFQTFFAIDVDNDDLCNVDFPTFEEALSVLDIAVQRGESFRGFDIENLATNSNRIGFVRQYLVMLLATAIKDGLDEGIKGLHGDLVANLDAHGLLASTSFLTTNYDILADNALARHGSAGQDIVDYGIEFKNPSGVRMPIATDQVHKLFKLHGSLNWLYCSTCRNLAFTPFEKGIVARLGGDFGEATCPTCDSVFLPIIVPPTMFKDMSNLFLAMVWKKAEELLQEVDHIVFCGYSFPDADLHVKYLLKRVQINRSRPPRFTVCNEHNNKDLYEREQERSRFKRFLGRHVDYTKHSFESFVDNLDKVLQPRAPMP